MKAQAALEFLTTYGWALASIMIAVGALSYFGFFSIDRYTADYCDFGPQLICKDYSISSDQVLLELQNNYGFDIQIINFSIIYKDSTYSFNTPPSSWWACFSDAGDPNCFSDCGEIGLFGCVKVSGNVSNDATFILDTGDWGGTSVNLPSKKKDRINVEIWYRRVDPLNYTDGSGPPHVVRGVVFTYIQP